MSGAVLVRVQGEPVEQEAASSMEAVAFQVGFDLHSKQVVLGPVQRSLEQSWQWADGSKKHLVKGMVLEAQMLLLKDTCERVYCHL